MHLSIITPEKVVLQEEIDELIIPTINGQITILPHHANLITQVVHGEMTVKKGNKEDFLAVTGGFLEVANNKISLLADYAVKAEDIEVDKALEAQKRANEVMKKSKENITERDFAMAQSELRKSILELDIANRRKRRQR